MSKTVYTIGRDESCDICLYDSENIVSRYHAVLKVRGRGRYVIVDQSLNGTYINGVKIVPEKEVPVSRKDTVIFAEGVILDWSLIPDDGSEFRRIAMGVLIIVVSVVLVVMCLLWYMNSRQSRFYDVEKPEMELDYPERPALRIPDTDNTAGSDDASLIVRQPERVEEDAEVSSVRVADSVREPEETVCESANIDAIY
ncbi:MAG TPA: FHA domain-containing protein [Candidatus Coprenecus pullistercoris]|nr:FHA domain-containing protein [Candidatus Coprenecus pullistercoris]